MGTELLGMRCNLTPDGCLCQMSIMSLRLWRMAFEWAVRLGLGEPLIQWLEDKFYLAALRRPPAFFPWWAWSDRGARA